MNRLFAPFKNTFFRFGLLLIVSIFGLKGCSFFSFFYNNLDSYLMFELKSVITLSTKQETQAEKSIEKLLRWHRLQRMPQYVQWIDEYKRRVNNGFDDKDASWVIDLFRAEWQLLVKELSKELVPLTENLTSSQIQQLQDFFEEKNEDYQEETIALEDDEYYQELEEDMVERMEKWLGDLTPQQLTILQQAVAKIKDDRKLYRDYRMKKQQQWIDLLTLRLKKGKSASLSDALWQQKMVALATRERSKNHPPNTLSNEYLSLDEFNDALIREAVVACISQINAQQKAHLFEEVNFYQNEFIELISD